MTVRHGATRTALIGHTGFVGSNLDAATTFDDHYASANLADIRGRSYDLVVSAAGRADSHRINANGAADRAELDQIVDHLAGAHIAKLVLVSTVCVYPGGSTPDEDTPVTDIGLLPYGANRAHLERRLTDQLDTLVIRLPQLYGRNLSKGIVYDLLHDYRVEHIVPTARYQFYDLARLWADIGVGLAQGWSALNLAVPPLTSGTVARAVFGRDLGEAQVDPYAVDPNAVEPYTKDMRTRHHDQLGGPPGYLMTADQSLDDLRSFVAASRSRPKDD